MSNKVNDDEDLKLFQKAMSGVRPLDDDDRIHPVQNQKPVKIRSHTVDEENADAYISDPLNLKDVLQHDELSFARSGIQHKLQKKLKRGELTIEDELDLHGYTAVQAKTAINDFFENARNRGYRCIRIIHGKGQRSEEQVPILKSYVAHWLPQYPEVLAFCSATPRDGGTGAAYVLLKTKR